MQKLVAVRTNLKFMHDGDDNATEYEPRPYPLFYDFGEKIMDENETDAEADDASDEVLEEDFGVSDSDISEDGDPFLGF